MNADRIISMIIRQIMRRVIGRGINAGLNAATRGTGKSDSQPVPGGKEGQKRTRQSLRAGRRLSKF